MEEFKSNFLNVVQNNYYNPDGRARRKEFWQFVAVAVGISVVLSILAVILGAIAGILGTIVSAIFILVSVALVLPNITLSIRRLHDVNKSGWWLLLSLIPLAGLYLIYLFVTEGDRADNQFGPDPKANEA